MAQDLCPVRRILNKTFAHKQFEIELQQVVTYREASKIRLLLAGEDLQRCRFPDAVGADQAENLPRPRGRKAMQLEGVFPVAVGSVFFQVTRQVDDCDGFKGTFLETKSKDFENIPGKFSPLRVEFHR